MNVDKISFSESDGEALAVVLNSLFASDREEAQDIIDHYLSTDGEFSFAFAFSCGTLIVRVFDGDGYSFVFPYEISGEADICGAIERVVRYTVLEEIEPVFENVPVESIHTFFDLGFRHINLDSDSPGSETYRASLKNECSLIGEYPFASFDGIELSCLDRKDVTDYARLSRDAENNKFWGYDFRRDYADCEDEFFLELANRDFESSCALSFAVRADDKFVGEAVLSSFDYKGGADISIRILPEHQRKGYGGRAFSLLFDIAEEIGLVTLYSRVYKDNIASICLFSKDADEKREEDETVIFTYRLF